MATGLTSGLYATRTGEYEVLTDGTVWLIGGAELPAGTPRKRVTGLPADAVMSNAAMGRPTTGGTTPPGRGPHPDQAHGGWDRERK